MYTDPSRPGRLRHVLATLLICVALAWASACVAGQSTNAVGSLDRPLSLAEALDVALQQNPGVLKSRKDLEAAQGIVVQTRAIALPKVRVSGGYSITEEDAVDRLTIPLPPGLLGGFTGIDPGNQHWNADIRLVQSIYEGGRLTSSLRSARLTREQALAQHQAVVADTATEVRIAYYDVLVAAQQIVVNEASVQLLTRELEDTERRFAAGTVPSFNVLRAKVEVGNARPRLIRARNTHRIAKSNLTALLGCRVPPSVGEDIPLQLTGTLAVDKFEIELGAALAQAIEHRPELIALRKAEALRQEGIVVARAGYLPSAQVYGGYGSHNSSFSTDLGRDISGWQAGVQFSWDLFDGGLARGKVSQARALRERSQIEVDDAVRRIELEVRTAYSSLIEAWEVFESQKQVQEQANEAVRLSQARAEAGTGTQLDVLSAQTALTEARTTQVQAEHQYAVARTRLERAIGAFTPKS